MSRPKEVVDASHPQTPQNIDLTLRLNTLRRGGARPKTPPELCRTPRSAHRKFTPKPISAIRAIELPDDEGVAGLEGFQTPLERGATSAIAAERPLPGYTYTPCRQGRP